jgi:hypothetical protein
MNGPEPQQLECMVANNSKREFPQFVHDCLAVLVHHFHVECVFGLLDQSQTKSTRKTDIAHRVRASGDGSAKKDYQILLTKIDKTLSGVNPHPLVPLNGTSFLLGYDLGANTAPSQVLAW